MFKSTNFKVVLLTIVLCSLIGISNWTVSNQYKGYVKVHNTTSGKFIITDNKIYSVSELQTDEEPVKVASLARK